jgi:4-amino-4-deoxychorismate lyase
VTGVNATSPDTAKAVLVVVGRGVAPADEPVLRADDAGLTRGDGCFEGCRLIAGPDGVVVSKLDAHLARMTRSAAALEIPFDEAAWRAAVDTAAAQWRSTGEAAMRLLLTRGAPDSGVPTGLVSITALSPDIARQRRDGIRVVTLQRGFPAAVFAGAPWLLGGVKTLSYAVNMAASREAQRRSADDVVFVSADGAVLEAPTATVVWSAGRTLHTTPTGDTGILGGITQQLLYEGAAEAGWATEYTLATVDELHEAEAVWLVSSTRGPVEVVELDGKARPRHPQTDAEIRRLAGF